MSEKSFPYVLVGGGVAAASAIEGIREADENGPILLITADKHLPYHRPPLSKQLWLGKKKVIDIFVKDRGFYDQNGVTLVQSTRAAAIDPSAKTVTDDRARTYQFGKCLLATGGSPRRLAIPGGDMDSVCYFRNLDDYLILRRRTASAKSAVVIGGGFIGSEIAASLTANHVAVTMIYPSSGLCSRVLPRSLSLAMQEKFVQKGVRILSEDRPIEITRNGGGLVTWTQDGQQVPSDLVIVGVGIEPSIGLARRAGLETGDGIVVNRFLQTSSPDIYAAGDNALFPCQALGQMTRLEHWDNAISQGKAAGRNMAGAGEPFTYMPYFFSDLFEFGYEAVGEIDSRMETFADWYEENNTGVVYYLRQGRVRGAMMCNVWNKLDLAREMIRGGAVMQPKELVGAIK